METAHENCSGNVCLEREREIWWLLGVGVCMGGRCKDGKEFCTFISLGEQAAERS